MQKIYIRHLNAKEAFQASFGLELCNYADLSHAEIFPNILKDGKMQHLKKRDIES